MIQRIGISLLALIAGYAAMVLLITVVHGFLNGFHERFQNTLNSTSNHELLQLIILISK